MEYSDRSLFAVYLARVLRPSTAIPVAAVALRPSWIVNVCSPTPLHRPHAHAIL
jgi:hypothetical protein